MASQSPRAQDALSLLKADHAKVQKMFQEFEKLDEEDEEERAELVRRTCSELKVHTQIEEELFYPALRQAFDDQELLEEAQVEHNSAKDLIEQLEGMEPQDEKFAATFKVLGEYVNHHIKEEQGEIFTKAKKTDIDLDELGEKLLARKEELAPQSDEELEEETGEEEGFVPRRSSSKKKGSAEKRARH